MHGTFKRSRETSDRGTHRDSGFGYLAIPLLMAVALVGLAIAQPGASVWISEAAQAEFAASFIMPDAAPTEVTRPADEIRTVRAN